MNSRERRGLNRAIEKEVEIIAARRDDPTGQRRPSEETGHTKETQTKPHKEQKNRKTEAGRKWPIAKRTAQILSRIIAALVMTLGLVTGYLSLIPRVSVSQGDLLNPAYTFSNPFIVSNGGPLPLETVTFRCGVGEAKLTNGPQVQGAPNFGSSFFIFNKNGQPSLPVFNSAEMLPGERATIPYCSVPWTNPAENADIGIVVSFRIGYTPIRETRTFQFVTRKDSQGYLRWLPDPLK
jgi:hypothetical protein